MEWSNWLGGSFSYIFESITWISRVLLSWSPWYSWSFQFHHLLIPGGRGWTEAQELENCGVAQVASRRVAYSADFHFGREGDDSSSNPRLKIPFKIYNWLTSHGWILPETRESSCWLAWSWRRFYFLTSCDGVWQKTSVSDCLGLGQNSTVALFLF